MKPTVKLAGVARDVLDLTSRNRHTDTTFGGGLVVFEPPRVTRQLWVSSIREIGTK